jgi:hypothetical protein
MTTPTEALREAAEALEPFAVSWPPVSVQRPYGDDMPVSFYGITLCTLGDLKRAFAALTNARAVLAAPRSPDALAIATETLAKIWSYHWPNTKAHRWSKEALDIIAELPAAPSPPSAARVAVEEIEAAIRDKLIWTRKVDADGRATYALSGIEQAALAVHAITSSNPARQTSSQAITTCGKLMAIIGGFPLHDDDRGPDNLSLGELMPDDGQEQLLRDLANEIISVFPQLAQPPEPSPGPDPWEGVVFAGEESSPTSPDLLEAAKEALVALEAIEREEDAPFPPAINLRAAITASEGT